MGRDAIVLIDGNNFYASCEALLDPAVLGRPLVVLSNNDGCVVSRSAEARALGIRMGQPYFQVRRELERQGASGQNNDGGSHWRTSRDSQRPPCSARRGEVAGRRRMGEFAGRICGNFVVDHVVDRRRRF